MKKIKYLISAAVTSVALIAAVAMPATVFATKPPKVKVNICHEKGNDDFQAINVDEEGWNGHDGHEGDFLYSGPTKEDGKPDNKDKQAEDWCKNNQPGDACLNIEGKQEEAPEGQITDESGNCVNKPVVVTPQVLGTSATATPAATQVAAPVSGVKAGAGGAGAASIASLLGLGSSLGATSLGLAIRNKRKN